MKIALFMALFGFLSGLKAAAKDTQNAKQMAVAFGLSTLLLFFLAANVAGGYGQMFWGVMACAGVSGALSVLSMQGHNDWMDHVSLVSFALGYAVMGIDFIALLTGLGTALLLYRMPKHYAQHGEWMDTTVANMVWMWSMIALWVVVATGAITVHCNLYTLIRFIG